MSGQDWEQLTLFPADSPASPSPSPGSAEARRMTVTSGLRCLESYRRSGPLGSLVRTCLGSSIWHSTRCYLIWKESATKDRRSLYQLAVSTPRTEECDAPFWPTPLANGYGSQGHRKTLKAMEQRGLITEEERLGMQAGNGGKINPAFWEWLMGYEQQFTKLIPTPRASDYKGAAPGRVWLPRSQIVQVERERERESGPVPASALRTDRTHSAWENWPVEPGIPRVVDGVPNRVDRIRCLGNAVVPQQFYPFFAAIKNEIIKEETE